MAAFEVVMLAGSPVTRRGACLGPVTLKGVAIMQVSWFVAVIIGSVAIVVLLTVIAVVRASLDFKTPATAGRSVSLDPLCYAQLQYLAETVGKANDAIIAEIRSFDTITVAVIAATIAAFLLFVDHLQKYWFPMIVLPLPLVLSSLNLKNDARSGPSPDQFVQSYAEDQTKALKTLIKDLWLLFDAIATIRDNKERGVARALYALVLACLGTLLWVWYHLLKEANHA